MYTSTFTYVTVRKTPPSNTSEPDERRSPATVRPHYLLSRRSIRIRGEVANANVSLVWRAPPPKPALRFGTLAVVLPV